MFSRIEFILSETFISLRRHPMMAFAAISCVAATLFVAGIVGLALKNADYAVESTMDKVRFVVFFRPEPKTTRDEARAAFQRIVALPEVESAEYIPSERPWEKLKKEDPELVRLVKVNPYPDSVEVKAIDVTTIKSLRREISQWPEVDSVKEPEGVSKFLTNARQAISNVGTIMGIILLLLSLVIIHHTIELTLYARRKEIHIMSLVGATPSTVAAPFLLEGVVYGLAGGGIAFGFLTLLYNFFALAMRNDYGAHLWQQPDMLTNGVIVLLVSGFVLGLTGSTVSVIKYLHRPRSKITNA